MRGESMAWRIGVDSGGTFTDVCLFDEDSGQITKEPISPLPYWFALPQAPIISRDSGIGVDAVGAGPFVMVENERGVRVRLQPFPKFFRAGLPRIKELNMTVYADENLRVLGVAGGQS
jgi:peptide/nickel transport system substrate-binding protein